MCDWVASLFFKRWDKGSFKSCHRWELVLLSSSTSENPTWNGAQRLWAWWLDNLVYIKPLYGVEDQCTWLCLWSYRFVDNFWKQKRKLDKVSGWSEVVFSTFRCFLDMDLYSTLKLIRMSAWIELSYECDWVEVCPVVLSGVPSKSSAWKYDFIIGDTSW